METLESSRVCRLCGKQSGISINIFDKNENHVKKINAILPIMVHEMDLLPKHMCHRCSYKLEEFHKFYVDCLRTDEDLKSQLSWMRKEDSKERVGVPMVHIENIKIKVEPPDYDVYDMNPMVDNIDYINSMSSVTFPVNGTQSNDISEGIAYTAYARCGCYCDKADQSNQTVSTNYKNAISRCNRLNDVRMDNDGCAKELRAVKKNLLANKTLRRRSNVMTLVNEAKDSRWCGRPTSSTFNRVDYVKGKSSTNENLMSSNIVRNLRPRKRSIDYTETKKRHLVVPSAKLNGKRSKSAESKTSAPSAGFVASQIKVEKLDDFEGRILRPRKGTIDYIGPKRKYSKSMDKNQRSQGDKHRPGKHKVRNIVSKLKVPLREVPDLLENTIKRAIKEEQLSDTEDTVLDESVSSTMLPNNRETSSIGDLADKIDTLPNDCVTNVQNDRIDRDTSNSARCGGNFNITNKWTSLQNASRNKLKSERIGLNRIAVINYSPKYLRSQDVYLRNGKVKKLDSAEVSARKLRRSLRNITDRGKTVGKNLMKAIKGTTSVKKLPATFIDNIKHYCEECNTSFANKELFKLHACYR